MNYWKLSTVLLASAMVVVLASDKGKKTSRELSPEVAAKLLRLYPDYAPVWVEDGKEKGEKILRVRLKSQVKKENILAKVGLDGEVLDLDEDLPLKEVPGHITEACRKAFPEAEITHAEKGIKLETTYRLDIVKNQKRHEVSLTRQGRIYEVESRD